MRYCEFENIISHSRMSRYLDASGGNTRKAMTLYRLNLRLSQELFTVISCFEITLRNAINKHCLDRMGNDWLKKSATNPEIFNNNHCRLTATNINDAITKLSNSYTHNKLVAEMGFGFWRYMFASHQYNAMGKTLLYIFPSKPSSTAAIQYNQKYVFNQLARINDIRNRIAHHEPICFRSGQPIIETNYSKQQYILTKQFFQWMNIEETTFLYGLDHIDNICDRIDTLIITD